MQLVLYKYVHLTKDDIKKEINDNGSLFEYERIGAFSKLKIIGKLANHILKDIIQKSI